MQYEITRPGPLLDENGRLRELGYSRRFLLDYNPEKIKLSPLRALTKMRIKEWDYYATTTRDYFFSATVADVGFIGLVFVYFIDFHDLWQAEKMVVTPLGALCRLPRTSESGDIRFRFGGRRVNLLREPGHRTIEVDWPDFHKGKALNARLTCAQPRDMDSIVMCTPMGGPYFYYNHKVNCMPTQGRITLGDRVMDLHENDALTALDWGRGVWPYATFWNWANASGFLADGRRFGINLGEGFGDLSWATENCFYLDGKMTKLEGLRFDYDAKDYMKPWRFRSDDDKLELTLTPFLDRQTKTDLAVIRTEVHQMFGRYSGRVTTEEGERIAIDGLIGWAEEHRARW